MPQAVNPLTPIDADVEERLITFDFGRALNAGVTLINVTAVTCEVVDGTDVAAAQRIKTSGTIVNAMPPPDGTGRAAAAVSVLVGDMLAGVTYLLQCVAFTSDSQELSLWQHLECVEPR